MRRVSCTSGVERDPGFRSPQELPKHVFRGGAVALYGEEDGFVCKLRPDGSALVFCTYFGTNDFNIVRDIDIDPQGNVYIASSAELDFPASDTYFAGSYQPTARVGLDCVIAKLNASGSSFAWATWIGGSGDDGTQPSVRVDGQGNVWYAGGAQSTDLPLVNPSQTQFGGDVDIYLAKLSADGKDLLFATYLGGSGAEGSETHNLAVNRATGDIYVGSASSVHRSARHRERAATSAGWRRAGTDSSHAIATPVTLLSPAYVGGPVVDRFEGNPGRHRRQRVPVGDRPGHLQHGWSLRVRSAAARMPPGSSSRPPWARCCSGSRSAGPHRQRTGGGPDAGRWLRDGRHRSEQRLPESRREQPQFRGRTSDGWLGRFIPR